MSTSLLKVPSLSTCTSAIMILFVSEPTRRLGIRCVASAITSIHPTPDIGQKAGFCLSATARFPLAFRGITAIELPPLLKPQVKRGKGKWQGGLHQSRTTAAPGRPHGNPSLIRWFEFITEELLVTIKKTMSSLKWLLKTIWLKHRNICKLRHIHCLHHIL